MDAEAMNAHELQTIGMEFPESKVSNGGLGMVSAKPFGPNEVIGTYYRSLHYEELSVVTKTRTPV